MPAPVQITAEQLLREAKERELELVQPVSKTTHAQFAFDAEFDRNGSFYSRQMLLLYYFKLFYSPQSRRYLMKLN